MAKMPWEEYEWDASKLEVINHHAMRDLRKLAWLLSKGSNADEVTAVREGSIPATDPVRYKLSWEDVMNPYPSSDITYPVTGTPTNCEKNVDWAATFPGELRCWFERTFEHNLLGVVLTGSDYEFKFAATSITLFDIYDQTGCTLKVKLGSAGAPEQVTFDIEKDDFRPGTPFLIQDSDAGNDGFYRVRSVRTDGSNVFVIADNNNYEQQTLSVTAVAAGTASCDFGGDWYVLRSGNGNSTARGNGIDTDGQMNAYFANYGDSTYERGPDQAGSVTDKWWSNKDKFHRYEPVSYAVAGPPYESYVANFGPNDGRPPMGGQLSKDFNGDWARCDNPNLYSTYDANSHRFHIEGSLTGGWADGVDRLVDDVELQVYLTQTHNFFNAQCDPKEIVSPHKYLDTGSNRWVYGEKVKLRRNQITNPDALGTMDYGIRTGWITELGSFHPSSLDSQYVSMNSYDPGDTNTGLKTQIGFLPVEVKTYMSLQDGNVNHAVTDTDWWKLWEVKSKTSQSDWNTIDTFDRGVVARVDGTSSPQARWICQKYSEGIQNMVERLCGQKTWLHEADDTYKTNWFDINSTAEQSPQKYGASKLLNAVEEWYWYETVTGTETYSDLWVAEGLDAWKPEFNKFMNPFPRMDDELFGENGSAFELILKDIGISDWWFDEHTHQSKRVMDDGWRAMADRSDPPSTWDAANLPGVHNGVFVTTAAGALEASQPMTSAAGTWRRTWRYSLGRVGGAKMRSGSLNDPENDTFSDFANTVFGTPGIPIHMVSRFKMNEPEPDEYYTWSQAITINEGSGDNPSGAKISSFTLSGDQRATFKEGWKVFDFVNLNPSVGDDTYNLYLILDVVYDADLDQTDVWMDDLFHENTPSIIYGDIAISSRHDAHETIDEEEVFNKNIYKILNECRSVMNELGLRLENIDIGIEQADLPPDHNIHLEESYEELVTYSNSNMISWHNGEEFTEVPFVGETVTWVTGVDTGGGISIGGIMGSTQFGSFPDWNISTPPGAWKKASIVLTLPYDIRGTNTKIYCYIQAFPSEFSLTDTSLPVFSVKGLFDLDIPQVPAGWTGGRSSWLRFGLIELASSTNLDETTYNSTNDTYEFRYRIDQEYEYFPGEFLDELNPFPGEGFITSEGKCRLINNNIAIKPDLSEIGEVWEKGYERADYGLVDPAGADVNPPVETNEWVIEPYVRAINYNASSQAVTFWKSVEPEWTIYAKAKHMVDYEGNGVFYIFDFTGGDPSDDPEDLASKMDKEQTAVLYDEVLDMDQSATAGDNIDAWKAFDFGITGWNATLNSRDNASVRPVNSGDNYGTPTAAVDLVFGAPTVDPSVNISEVPFFPSSTRWKSVGGLGTAPMQKTLDGTDYHWVATDQPYTDYPNMEYKVEFWDDGIWVTIYDYGATQPTPPVSAPDGSTDPGCYWIPQSFSIVTPMKFRMTFRNANQTVGLTSDEATSL